MNSRPYRESISLFSEVPYMMEKVAHSYKTYPAAPRIALPRLCNHKPQSLGIEEIIERRRTARQFTSGALALEGVSRLLHFSYGITGTLPISEVQKEYQYFRAAPSAGALYPLEIYLVVWRIEGLESGIYHYFVVDDALEIVKKGDFCRSVGEYTFSPDIAERAAVPLIISAMFQRTMFKYNERGYRFVLLDAGHVAQNVYLMATAMNYGVLPLGGFLDDELNRLLEIDGVNECAIYPIFVGTVSDVSSLTKL